MSPNQIQPTLDRVLVRRISPDAMSAGGIALPAGESQQAEVLAVGPGKDFPGGVPDPVPLKAGDRVVIGRGGFPVFVDGEELLVIRAAQVDAILEK